MPLPRFLCCSLCVMADPSVLTGKKKKKTTHVLIQVTCPALCTPLHGGLHGAWLHGSVISSLTPVWGGRSGPHCSVAVLCAGRCWSGVNGGQWAAASSPERSKLVVQAGRKANPVQCLLFSFCFSFTKKWVGQLEKNPKTWDDLQSICFLGGETGSSALQNVVFVFPARPLPILVVNVCGATLCCAEVCEFPEGS